MTDARGWVVHRYDRVASTMDVAGLLATFGATDRSAVVAAEQTSGRGRAGRTWLAPPGSSLFCTLILRPRLAPDRLGTLPLLAGVAVAEAIERLTDTPARLKWPNDVWLGADPERRKVAGILAASVVRGGAIDSALVGIGINVASDAESLPPNATSIVAATGKHATVEDLLAALLAAFDESYGAFLSSLGSPPLDRWRSRAVLVGEQVEIEDAGRVASGVFTGIDDDGALLLQIDGAGVRRFVSGDVTRGPRERSGRASPN